MRLSSLILAVVLFLFIAGVALAQTSVRLITIGPGDEVWEKFGHNMIEISGERGYGQDVSFNWGLFDFEQPNFIGRFVQGRMLYTMRPLRSGPMLEEYRQQNRSILVQELNLAPQQVDRLLHLLELNRRPENRDYRYDYFKDNCSTRVRDMIDRATEGEVSRLLAGAPTPAPMTYREHSLRLMRDELWLSLGIDFALGPSCDRVLDAWDEAFLPQRLSESLKPMVKASWSPWQSTRPPEPTDVPDRRLPMLIAGVVVAGVMGLLARSDRKWMRRAGSTLASVWWVLGAIGGLFMMYLWIFTDHTAGHANQNLLQFSPLAVVVLGAWVVAKRRASQRPRFLVGVLMGVVFVSLLGFVLKITTLFSQANLNFIALALPVNVAASLTVMRSVGLLRK